MLINVDAKYLDWVAAVYLSQDEKGIEEIRAGFDLHTDNEKAFGLPDRLIAKIFLFRIIFGGTAYSFAKDPAFKSCRFSQKKWEDIIDMFYTKYRGVHKWHNELVQTAISTGKISIPTGREWTFTPQNRNGELVWPITTIKNYPVQGLEADLMQIARVSLFNRIKHDNSILMRNSVHDSIVLDCPSSRSDWCISICESVFEDIPTNFAKLFGVEFNIPVRCSISVGNNWGDMEEIK